MWLENDDEITMRLCSLVLSKDANGWMEWCLDH